MCLEAHINVILIVDLQELHQGKRVEREMGQGTEGALRTQRQCLGWLRQRVQFTTEGPCHWNTGSFICSNVIAL